MHHTVCGHLYFGLFFSQLEAVKHIRMVQKNFLGVWAREGNSEEEFKDEFLHIDQKSFHT